MLPRQCRHVSPFRTPTRVVRARRALATLCTRRDRSGRGHQERPCQRIVESSSIPFRGFRRSNHPMFVCKVLIAPRSRSSGSRPLAFRSANRRPFADRKATHADGFSAHGSTRAGFYFSESVPTPPLRGPDGGVAAWHPLTQLVANWRFAIELPEFHPPGEARPTRGFSAPQSGRQGPQKSAIICHFFGVPASARPGNPTMPIPDRLKPGLQPSECDWPTPNLLAPRGRAGQPGPRAENRERGETEPRWIAPTECDLLPCLKNFE